MNKKCRLLICDDHADFRDLVKYTLKRSPHIEVVGEAGDGREVVDKALTLRPDIVLMDLNMPVITGLEATRRIKQANKRIKVLILSAFGGDDVVSPCLHAGASGYVQKYRSFSELTQAIDAVRRGSTYLSRHVLETVSRANGSTLEK